MELAGRSARYRRKAEGAYYTPPVLVRLLLDQALGGAKGEGSIRVCDPACGAGDFLAAVQARLGARAAIYGVDRDPDAVRKCRAALEGGAAGSFAGEIVEADALLATPEFLRTPAPGFDLVVGNPPFVNPIEGYLSDGVKRRLRERFERVRGAADLAYYFLDLAIGLARPGGRVALVMPRGVLNAPAAAGLRGGLPSHLRPNVIWAPERADFFEGASVFICLIVLGPDADCRVSMDGDPAAIRWHRGTIESENWWREMQRIIGGGTPSAARPGRPRMGEVFQISASLTAGDAYDIRDQLVDSAEAAGQKFITTGLIDRGACSWGRRRCRYLRRDLAHPWVNGSEGLTASLARRLRESHRPKVLVAGLSRRIEAFLDDRGECMGAVSTYSIYHPADDVGELRRALEYLLSDEVSRMLVNELGGNGLRGRHITVKRAFLRGLEWCGAAGPDGETRPGEGGERL